jgi:hypothetical protein
MRKGGTVKDSDFDDAQTRKLLAGLRERLYDEIAIFLADHPEVPPAVVGVTVGRVFLNHFQICYPDDFLIAARDTFDLLLENPEMPIN